MNLQQRKQKPCSVSSEGPETRGVGCSVQNFSHAIHAWLKFWTGLVHSSTIHLFSGDCWMHGKQQGRWEFEMSPNKFTVYKSFDHSVTMWSGTVGLTGWSLIFWTHRVRNAVTHVVWGDLLSLVSFFCSSSQMFCKAGDEKKMTYLYRKRKQQLTLTNTSS